MPFFRAEVIDAAGHTRTVNVEAHDQRHAVERLNRKGLKPMALTEVADAPAPAPAHVVSAPAPAPAPAPDVSALQAELAQLRSIQSEQLNIARKGTSFGSAHRTFGLLLIVLAIAFVCVPVAIPGDRGDFQVKSAQDIGFNVVLVLMALLVAGWIAYGISAAKRRRSAIA
jgi:hypothetical protein